MVTLSSRTLPLLLIGAALGSPASLSGDGILEQMQNEVAQIVRHARRSVVSIEGVREVTQVAFIGPDMQMAASVKERIEQLRSQLRSSGNGKNAARQTEIEREIATLQQKVREWEQSGRERAQQMALEVASRPKSGTGFCIGDGLVLTTGDVLEGMKEPIVLTDDGARVKASVVGMDYLTNIGLLKLTARTDMPALPMADSSRVAVGHFAISIGNQSGQTNSVALTLVAGLRDEGMFVNNHLYPRLIQVAGTIGAGTSGAPLLNARGEVIGIVAAIPAGDWAEIPIEPTPSPGEQPLQSPSDTNENDKAPSGVSRSRMPIRFMRPPVTSAGYAIAINEVKPVLAELQASGGKIARGWLGVIVDDEARTDEEGGIQKITQMVKVLGVFPDSPAYSAGVQPGDVVLAMSGKPLRSTLDFIAAASKARIGNRIVMEVKRAAGVQSLEIHVGRRPKTTPPLLIAPAKSVSHR